MSAPWWPQLDAGTALVLGAIVETAAVRKLQRPRVFALNLQRLEPALASRRALTIRLALLVASFEAVVGAGVVAFPGGVGFVFACALLVACVAFLVALARAVQQSVPCACFGRLGRTAAGGREIGRGIALVLGAAFVVVRRALDPGSTYGAGLIAVGAAAAMVGLILVAQSVGAKVRPGVELPRLDADGRSAIADGIRSITGYDNDLYTTSS